MKFIDNNNKELKYYNRNYFWVVTTFYIVLNIMIFALIGSTNMLESLKDSNWQSFDAIREWLISIGNTYTHQSWDHVLHNMLGLFFCAFYIERKIGSINFALLLISLTLILPPIVSMSWGLSWSGNSLIWFALIGYVLIDYLFSFRKSERNLTNLIVGAVVLFLEWFRLGFYDKWLTGEISWVFAPYQLIQNAGHYIGFIVGVILALIICITSLQVQRRHSNFLIDKKATNFNKHQKFCKFFSVSMGIIISIFIAWIPVYVGIQNQREFISVFQIDCNIDQYDVSYTFDDLKLERCNQQDVIDFWLEQFELPYETEELNIKITDKIYNDNCDSFWVSKAGSPSYRDPWGFKDFVGHHFYLSITIH